MRGGTRIGGSRTVFPLVLVALCGGCDALFLVGPGEGEAATNGGAGASPQVYYVSTRGDDGADGTTATRAFRTIARAVGVLRPGDTIAILPGTYQEALALENAGDAQAPITIRGEGPAPVFDGGRTLKVGFRCEQCTNVVFDGLEFRNYTDVGIIVTLSAEVILRNLIVHDNGFAATLEDVEGYGIQAEDSQRITIDGNEVYQNGPNPQIPDRWLGTGIDTFGLTDSVIRNNHSHDNVGGGLLVEDSINVVVEGNRITSNNLDATVEQWWDGGIWVDGGHDVTLRNNTIRGNLGPGIEISDEDNQQPTGYVLADNTITGNEFGLYIWNFGSTDLPAGEILSMSGNDISGNTTQDLWIVAWECPPDDPCE